MELTARQNEIVDKVLEIMAKGGIQSVTTRNIAEAVGVSEPALYRHFKDKQEILLALLDRFMDIEKEIIGDQDSQSCEQGRCAIRQIFGGHIELFYGQPHLASLIFSEELFLNNEVLLKKMLEVMDFIKDGLLKILKRGVAAGHIRNDIPVEHVVHIYLGSLRLLVTRWHLSGYKFDLREAGNQFWMSFIKLIFA